MLCMCVGRLNAEYFLVGLLYSYNRENRSAISEKRKEKYLQMEIKMNKEIRGYAETMFFGLSLRQFLFSAAGCLISIGIFFLLRNRIGTEAVTWACILGVFPCGLLGFAKYNGMSAERFLWAVIKSQGLYPKRLVFRSSNLMKELSEGGKKNAEIN